MGIVVGWGMCDPVCVSVLILSIGNLRLQYMCVYVLSLSMTLSMSKTYPAFTAVRKLKYYKVDSKEQIRTMSFSYYVCRTIFKDMQVHLINVSIASLKYDNIFTGIWTSDQILHEIITDSRDLGCQAISLLHLLPPVTLTHLMHIAWWKLSMYVHFQ